MRKIVMFGLIALALLLASCGTSGAEGKEDVYQNALEASKEMESAELNVTSNQTIAGNPDMGEMTMEMEMDVAMTMDPIAMHQTGTMVMDFQGMPMETEVEMYMAEDGMYMYESMSQMWMKMDNSMMPAELTDMEQNPADQLAMLESHLDDIEFVEEDERYIYRFNGEGEDVTELTNTMIEENFGNETFAELGIDIEEMMEGLEINSIIYELHLDKETYHAQKVTTDMDISIAVGESGELMQLQQKTTAEYTDINGIDAIEVPQEVIDSAQEM